MELMTFMCMVEKCTSPDIFWDLPETPEGLTSHTVNLAVSVLI